jgi:hypothetical protein
VLVVVAEQPARAIIPNTEAAAAPRTERGTAVVRIMMVLLLSCPAASDARGIAVALSTLAARSDETPAFSYAFALRTGRLRSA